MKPLLSILLMARDEEARLPAFFKAVKEIRLPHEIVVVDSGSKDRSVDIARKYGARVFRMAWQGFSETKNQGILKCRAAWIWSLDADENPSPALCREVEKAVHENAFEGYQVCRLNYFLGKPIRHSGWYPDWQLRLFRKGGALFNSRRVHEGLELTGGGPQGRLNGELHHFSYPNLNSYFLRLNRYTSLQAEELFEKKGSRPLEAFLRLLLDPFATFLKMVVLKKGFLDGREGWLLAALSSSSTFWKYAKWWHLSWAQRGGKAGEPWVLGRG